MLNNVYKHKAEHQFETRLLETYGKWTKLKHICRGKCQLLLHTHTHPFNGPLSRTTRVSRYQKGKTNLDFTEARDSEWQWNPLGHMQVCTSLQTDKNASASKHWRHNYYMYINNPQWLHISRIKLPKKLKHDLQHEQITASWLNFNCQAKSELYYKYTVYMAHCDAS